MKKGIVVKIDGIDGCGKTTLIERLSSHYAKEYKVCTLSEFGAHNDTTIIHNGCQIEVYNFLRHLAKSDESDLDDISRELLWVIISRHTNIDVIASAILTADLILVDRSDLGNIAYGCAIDNRLYDVYRILSTSVEISDLWLWLDTPIETCLQRISSRKLDHIESKGFEFFTKVRNYYSELTQNNPRALRIDGAASEEELANTSIRIINEFISHVS